MQRICPETLSLTSAQWGTKINVFFFALLSSFLKNCERWINLDFQAHDGSISAILCQVFRRLTWNFELISWVIPWRVHLKKNPRTSYLEKLKTVHFRLIWIQKHSMAIFQLHCVEFHTYDLKFRISHESNCRKDIP